MPSTRQSLGTAQPGDTANKPSLKDISSERNRREVESLCKKWEVSLANFLAFFGTEALTAKFLSALRDLRARVPWNTAKHSLDEAITSRLEKAGLGPSSSPPPWVAEDVKTAIAQIDASRRTSNGTVGTRSSRSSAVMPPASPSSSSSDADSTLEQANEANPTATTPEPSRKTPTTRGALREHGSASSRRDAKTVRIIEHTSQTTTTEHSTSATTSSNQPSLSSTRKRSAGTADLELPPAKRTEPSAGKPTRSSRRSLNKEEPSTVANSSPLSSVSSTNVGLEGAPDTGHNARPTPSKTRGATADAETGPTKGSNWLADGLAPDKQQDEDIMYRLISTLATCSTRRDALPVVIHPLILAASSTPPVRDIKTMLSEKHPDTLLLPMHLRGHWVLVKVHPETHRVDLLDSMPSLDNRTKAGEIFSRFARNYLGRSSSSWQIAEVSCAEQDDERNSSVFVAANAIYVLAGQTPPGTLAADPWRKAFLLFADEQPAEKGAFAEFLNLPIFDDVPNTLPIAGDDIATFHELRKTWSTHFEGRIATLSASIAQMKQLEEMETVFSALTQEPDDAVADPAIKANADLEKLEQDLNNHERQLELRLELSQLPGCESETQNLSPLREKVAGLRARVEEAKARREARLRLGSIIEILREQNEDVKLALTDLGGKLAQYRDLYIGTAATDI
ncbi:hypothetical protein CcaCcLH18_03397 [Colletotrichum camelliae]|nr:hypothetical protein CcaCcLH18_03397 [Colletotrichum camelliae]